jgi:hypothetical protein
MMHACFGDLMMMKIMLSRADEEEDHDDDG